MGPGNILGLEDIARIKPHSYSAKCVSHTGTILKMDVEKFHQVISKYIALGFGEMQRLNKAQWKSFYDKLVVLEGQIEHIKDQQTKILANSNTDGFTNMEFFKVLYSFQKKLSPQKMSRIFEKKEKAANDLISLQESKRNQG